VFLDASGEPLLTGFGYSRFISGEMSTKAGTVRFTAPELLRGICPERYADKVDVFAYGMLLYTTFTTKLRWDGGRNIGPNGRCDSDLIQRGKRPVRTPGVPGRVWKLITDCWAQQPTARPSFPDSSGG
jgi:serine/threonine protein kinase